MRGPMGVEVAWVEEPSYFFKLSAWADRLLELYDSQPDFILPKSRRNEVISFVKGGLHDLSVSRTTFNWGIPVPNDDKHIMYVWLDALTNYITAVGFPDENKDSYQKFWPADLHMVGKDILRFHAVYWPAFLMAAELPLPKRVFAHGWWTNEGQKISKSIGNVIDPNKLIEQYGLDQTRYFLMREVPFGNDGDFAHEAMVTRMNSDLANALGNLCQRGLSMIAKNCDGKIPEPGELTAEDRAIQASAQTMLQDVRKEMDQQGFSRALERIWQTVSDANVYVDEQAPWALRKTDFKRMETVLFVLTGVYRKLALILNAYMPQSTDKVLDLLAVDASDRSFDTWEDEMVPGTELPKPAGVFPRYVEEKA